MRDRDRQTDRQIETQTQRDRESERDKERQRHRETETERDRETRRQRDTGTERHSETETYRAKTQRGARGKRSGSTCSDCLRRPVLFRVHIARMTANSISLVYG